MTRPVIYRAPSRWGGPRPALGVAVVILLVSLGTTSHAEDEDGEMAAVRSRLLEAYRANQSIHHALRLPRPADEADGTDWVFEAYVEGVIGGVRGFRGQEEGILVATDGRILVARGPGQEPSVADGVLTVRRARAPYYALRRRWRDRWACPLIVDPEWGLCLDFQLGPKIFKYGLFATTRRVPGWLKDGFLADKRLFIDEAAGIVHMHGPGCRGTIRLSDGLPVTWVRLDEQDCERATIRETAPLWTAEKWRATIQEACGQVPKEGARLRLGEVAPGLLSLVSTAVIYGDDLLRFDEATGDPVGEAKTVIEEIASVEVSSDPPDGGESAEFYAGMRRGVIERAVVAAQEEKAWPWAKRGAFIDALVGALRRRAAASLREREGGSGK